MFSNNQIKKTVRRDNIEREWIASSMRAVVGDELLAVAAGFVRKGHTDGAGADEWLKVALKGVLA